MQLVDSEPSTARLISHSSFLANLFDDMLYGYHHLAKRPSELGPASFAEARSAKALSCAPKHQEGVVDRQEFI